MGAQLVYVSSIDSHTDISRKPNTREPRTLSAGEVMSRHTAPAARLP